MDDQPCPLCLEVMDETDLQGQLCDCNYKICLFCHNKLTEEANKLGTTARCPNCRTEYDQDRIRRQRLDPTQLEEAKKRGRKEEKKKLPPPTGKIRKELANVRVVQRNLVYVVGLAMDVCYEDKLKSPEFFGQFGKVVKISVSRSGPYGTSAAKNGPTGSAYITFKRNEDARRCIEMTHNVEWQGKLVKACYGTTKYCNAFLKGMPCNNPDCLYLHDVAEEEDSYTKEETKTAKFVQLVHAASIAKQANAQSLPQTSAGMSRIAAGATTPRGGDRASPVDELLEGAAEPPPLLEDGLESWPSLGGGFTLGTAVSWATKAAPATIAARPPPPPDVDTQEWPELSMGPAASASQPVGAAGVRSPPRRDQPDLGSVLGPPANNLVQSLQRKGSTMAETLARAASLPKVSKAARPKEVPSSGAKLTPLVPAGSTRQTPKVVSPPPVAVRGPPHDPAAASQPSPAPPSDADAFRETTPRPVEGSGDRGAAAVAVSTPQGWAQLAAGPSRVKAEDDAQPQVKAMSVEPPRPELGAPCNGDAAAGVRREGPVGLVGPRRVVGAAKAGPPPGFGAPAGGKKPGPPPGFSEPVTGLAPEANGSLHTPLLQVNGSHHDVFAAPPLHAREAANGVFESTVGPWEERPSQGLGTQGQRVVADSGLPPRSVPSPVLTLPTQDPVVPPPTRNRKPPTMVAPIEVPLRTPPPASQLQHRESSFLQAMFPNAAVPSAPSSGPAQPPTLLPTMRGIGDRPPSLASWLQPAPPPPASAGQRSQAYDPLKNGMDVRLPSHEAASRFLEPVGFSPPSAGGLSGLQRGVVLQQQSQLAPPSAGHMLLRQLQNGGGLGLQNGGLQNGALTSAGLHQQAQYARQYMPQGPNGVLDPVIINAAVRSPQLGPHAQLLRGVQQGFAPPPPPQYGNSIASRMEYVRQQPHMVSPQYSNYMSGEESLLAQFANVGLYANDRGPLYNGMQGR